jgi:hypothetical protein
MLLEVSSALSANITSWEYEAVQFDTKLSEEPADAVQKLIKDGGRNPLIRLYKYTERLTVMSQKTVSVLHFNFSMLYEQMWVR